MARKIENFEPAFPRPEDGTTGMSFRDYVVVKMMAALVTRGDYSYPDQAAKKAYAHTEALLDERENRIETEDIV